MLEASRGSPNTELHAGLRRSTSRNSPSGSSGRSKRWMFRTPMASENADARVGFTSEPKEIACVTSRGSAASRWRPSQPVPKGFGRAGPPDRLGLEVGERAVRVADAVHDGELPFAEERREARHLRVERQDRPGGVGPEGGGAEGGQRDGKVRAARLVRACAGARRRRRRAAPCSGSRSLPRSRSRRSPCRRGSPRRRGARRRAGACSRGPPTPRRPSGTVAG